MPEFSTCGTVLTSKQFYLNSSNLTLPCDGSCLCLVLFCVTILP